MPSSRSHLKPPTKPEPLEPGRVLRADAKRNRERLLTAADALFSERGADASMDDVAKRAKVGIGTLYRHFPTREALLAATVEDRLLAIANKEASLLASAATADALGTYLAALVENARTYRGLAASLGVVLQSGSPGCKATTELGKRLLERAKTSGEVRRTVDFADVVCMAMAIALAVQETPSDLARARRLVAMFVDGLRAPAAAKRDHKP